MSSERESPPASRFIPSLVTHSGRPDSHFIREAAIAHYAAEMVLGHDSDHVENAVAHGRAVFDKYEDAEHDGDCVNQACACIRCHIEEAKAWAAKEHDE